MNLLFIILRIIKQTICWIKGSHMFVLVKKSEKLSVYECQDCYTIQAFVVLKEDEEQTK